MYDNECNSAILTKNFYSLVLSWEKMYFLGWGVLFSQSWIQFSSNSETTTGKSEKLGNTQDNSHVNHQIFCVQALLKHIILQIPPQTKDKYQEDTTATTFSSLASLPTFTKMHLYRYYTLKYIFTLAQELKHNNNDM